MARQKTDYSGLLMTEGEVQSRTAKSYLRRWWRWVRKMFVGVCRWCLEFGGSFSAGPFEPADYWTGHMGCI